MAWPKKIASCDGCFLLTEGDRESRSATIKAEYDLAKLPPTPALPFPRIFKFDSSKQSKGTQGERATVCGSSRHLLARKRSHHVMDASC